MSEYFQTFHFQLLHFQFEIFITGNNKARSDEAIHNVCILWSFLAQRFRCQATQERSNAFNKRACQWRYLENKIIKIIFLV